ncbi:hypothetical protein GWI33_020489 [Rhynchophorus ferrugineus]|uniref:Uncharacterized protein n=1 Tax=Rhynchophorus ferrugineus TaxID=354439 RepID=A0A834HPB1_RHYFE|nr:hypothetical protein GWI33_020489 [Rhynchophorus ferrugineus]
MALRLTAAYATHANNGKGTILNAVHKSRDQARQVFVTKWNKDDVTDTWNGKKVRVEPGGLVVVEGKVQTDACWYSEEANISFRTLFSCQKWTRWRRETERTWHD